MFPTEQTLWTLWALMSFDFGEVENILLCLNFIYTQEQKDAMSTNAAKGRLMQGWNQEGDKKPKQSSAAKSAKPGYSTRQLGCKELIIAL